MAKIQVIIHLDDEERCNGCALLKEQSGQYSECLVGFWYTDEALDIDKSSTSGGLVYIRPQSCRDENEVL